MKHLLFTFSLKGRLGLIYLDCLCLLLSWLFFDGLVTWLTLQVLDSYFRKTWNVAQRYLNKMKTAWKNVEERRETMRLNLLRVRVWGSEERRLEMVSGVAQGGICQHVMILPLTFHSLPFISLGIVRKTFFTLCIWQLLKQSLLVTTLSLDTLNE